MYEVPTFLSSIELSIALFGQFHQDFGFPYPVTVQERIHFLLCATASHSVSHQHIVMLADRVPAGYFSYLSNVGKSKQRQSK